MRPATAGRLSLMIGYQQLTTIILSLYESLCATGSTTFIEFFMESKVGLKMQPTKIKIEQFILRSVLSTNQMKCINKYGLPMFCTCAVQYNIISNI